MHQSYYADMAMLAVAITILFVLLASPFAFKGSDWLFGKIKAHTIDAHGKPTVIGMIIHSIIFFLLLLLVLEHVPAYIASHPLGGY